MSSEPEGVREMLAAIRRGLVGRTSPLLVALDGRSGSGKSTVAAGIAADADAVVVDGDDFYAGRSEADWTALAPRERVELCIDWRRMRAEALEPLLAGKRASWRPHDWEAGVLAHHAVTAEPAPLIILDGAYSARPELADLVALTVLLEVPDEVRRRRLLAREGAEFMTGWHRVWDEAEDHYFGQVRPPSAFDLVCRI